MPLHTLRADIDYGFFEARTTFGRIGVKVWIYKATSPALARSALPRRLLARLPRRSWWTRWKPSWPGRSS
ncbi:SSU ribosomal protein S3p [Cutibacterium acnes JCM 18916]|nr:SSU ribosomal protein S3p [Cutibacterium acnes JCM 18916]